MMTTQVHHPTRSRPSSDGPGPRWPAPKTASGWRLIERDDVQQELLAGGVALLERGRSASIEVPISPEL